MMKLRYTIYFNLDIPFISTIIYGLQEVGQNFLENFPGKGVVSKI